MFAAKFLTGGLTGGLLQNYCPGKEPAPPPEYGGAPGVCYGGAIWAIIGATTLTSFIALAAGRKWLDVEDARDAKLLQTEGLSLEDEGDGEAAENVQQQQQQHADDTDDFELK